MLDEDDKKQIKEHIRSLEYVKDELVVQYRELCERIDRLDNLIEIEKAKLKNGKTV